MEQELTLYQFQMHHDQKSFSIDQLYHLFKLCEKNTKKYLQNKQTTMMYNLSEINGEDEDGLMKVSIVLIHKDLEFASAKKIDQRLWELLRFQKEVIQESKFVTPVNQEDYLHYFKRQIDIFQTIAMGISKFNLNIQYSDMVDSSKKRRITANLISYLGELTEMRANFISSNKIKTDQDGFKIAAAQYYNAIRMFPFAGKFSYLLAQIQKSHNDAFGAIYWCLRAYSSVFPYPCKEKLYEDNRITFLSFKKSEEQNKIDYLNQTDLQRIFSMYYLRFHGIVFTNIGYEDLDKLSIMFKYMQKYLDKVKVNDYKADENLARRDSSYLSQILILSIFLIFKKIEGYTDSEKFDINRHKKSLPEIELNGSTKQVINLIYGIFSNILDAITEIDSEIMQDIMNPVVYYLSEFHNHSQFFFQTHKHFSKIFLKLHDNLILRLAKYDKMSDKHLTAIFQQHLFPCDMGIAGFVPVQIFFHNSKEGNKVFYDSNKAHLNCQAKTFMLSRYIQQLTGFDLEVTRVDSHQISSNIVWDENIQENIDEWDNLSHYNLAKTTIVVDGMNVAMRFGDSKFRAEGLKITMEYWEKLGHPVCIMLPDFCFSKEAIEKKRIKIQAKNFDTSKLPDKPEILIELKKQGHAIGIPDKDYDDSYMIQYARQSQGYILTNDQYRDHVQKVKDKKQQEILKEWLRNNLISFTTIKGELLPDPDFMKIKSII